MKRFYINVLLLIVALITSLSASAQLRYGFRLGGIISDARISDAPDFGAYNKGGFSGGLMLEYQVPDNGIAIDAALLYSRVNARIKDGEDVMGGMNRDFLEIPVHLKYKYWLKSVNNLVAPMVYTGPSFMFGVGKNNNHAVSTARFQPGWDVGIGFDIVNFIEITGGYRFGLGNALKSFAAAPDAKFHTNGWNISVNLIFDF